MMSGVESDIEIAKRNLSEQLLNNSCRGIAVGLSDDGFQRQICWIMGRSPPSRNRAYDVIDDDANPEVQALRTQVADRSQDTGGIDPQMLIYSAMSTFCNGREFVNVVSNGDHTDTAIGFIKANSSLGFPLYGALFGALEERICEPDPPIFTPRILGLQTGRYLENVYLGIVKANPWAKAHWIDTIRRAGDRDITLDSFRKEGRSALDVTRAYNAEIDKLSGLDHRRFPSFRTFYDFQVKPGFGYALLTYKPNSLKTLDSFEGEPFLVPFSGRLEDVMRMFWSGLLEDCKVSIGGRDIEQEGKVRMADPINKYKIK